MVVESALELLAADPAATGIFTDFDGTLSPIVDRPEDARPVEGATEVLEELASRFAVVAVVSGRSLDDLESRFSPEKVVLAGSYGRDRSGSPQAEPARDWGEVVGVATDALGGLDGVRLERKGSGVALHYRGAPQSAAAVGGVAATLALEFGLEVRPGRLVVELVQPGPGKGEAIRDLIAEHGLARVLVAGDDVADEEAFALVTQIPVESVLVAVRSDESPPGLLARADVVVDGPTALLGLLKTLGRLLPR